MLNYKYTNNLIKETSPYLLQHAHNPVNWFAWNDETLQKAQNEKKLLIISIGYSSCHWCHVMEEESFENEDVAQVMNDNFICIKVDREERPDIDQYYMAGLQLLTGRGGWPLNAIALPDGRPVWAGSYVPRGRWIYVLEQIFNIFNTDRNKLIGQADNISNGIKMHNEIIFKNEKSRISRDFIIEVVKKWEQSFDYENGGYNYSPKFPLPNNFTFLLKYSFLMKDDKIRDFVMFTLKKIAFGGIYDHVEGGFSRYSVDERWHIPHFEKMLYDNAQLVSLYCEAYRISKNEELLKVINETLEFIKNSLTGPEGNFYSALDADSLNESAIREEGSYYYWNKEELLDIITDDFQLFSQYFNINETGHWENGKYVLIRTIADIEFAEKNNLNFEILKNKVKVWKNAMANAKNAKSSKDVKNSKKRKRRKKPMLDDKTITSWNAMMSKAYCDAYKLTENTDYLDAAQKNIEFVLSHVSKPDGSLYHVYTKSKAAINGFLEDYAHLISALIALYQTNFEEKYLMKAKDLTKHSFEIFYDEEKSLFKLSPKDKNNIITEHFDIYDNVISSANSLMANNLFVLGHYFNERKYIEIATKMLSIVNIHINKNPQSYSNWLSIYCDFICDFKEIAVTGIMAVETGKKIYKEFSFGFLLAASDSESEIPLLKDKKSGSETNIFICYDGSCQKPLQNLDEVLTILK
jgi:uncharacterized protein